MKQKKHPTKLWELSLIAVKDQIGVIYRVTRRLPELSVAETKVFRTKREAQEQFDAWLE